MVVKTWTRAWELGKIDEAQAREYLHNWFDAEITRLYWRMHGGWHRRGRRRDFREGFREIAEEEYQRAIRAGTAKRPLEGAVADAINAVPAMSKPASVVPASVVPAISKPVSADPVSAEPERFLRP